MRRPKLGDIVEIKTKRGLAYAQYTHENKIMGSLIRTIDGFHELRPQDIAAIAAGKTKFVTFFSLGAAVNRGIVEIVGNATIPEADRNLPLFRGGTANPVTRKVANWWLWDGEKSWPVGDITQEQRKLPLRGIWNNAYLVSRLESGWTPENDEG
jgi:hypothetical protein